MACLVQKCLGLGLGMGISMLTETKAIEMTAVVLTVVTPNQSREVQGNTLYTFFCNNIFLVTLRIFKSKLY